MYELTDEQADLIKDVLKTIPNGSILEAKLAKISGHSVDNFRMICDNAFRALGNGRISFDTSEVEQQENNATIGNNQ